MQRWGSEARPSSLLLQPDCRPAAVYCCTYDSVVTDMQRNDTNHLHFLLTIPEPFMKLHTIQTRVIYILFYSSLISLKTLQSHSREKCFHFRGKYFSEGTCSDVKSLQPLKLKLLLQLPSNCHFSSEPWPALFGRIVLVWVPSSTNCLFKDMKQLFCCTLTTPLHFSYWSYFTSNFTQIIWAEIQLVPDWFCLFNLWEENASTTERLIPKWFVSWRFKSQ